MNSISNRFYQIWGNKENFLCVKTEKKVFKFASPAFEINGVDVSFEFCEIGGVTKTNNGELIDVIYKGMGYEHINLHLRIKSCPDSPIFRFQYVLMSKDSVLLTKNSETDNIRYLGLELNQDFTFEEIQLSNFAPHLHTYLPVFRELSAADMRSDIHVPGPLMLAYDAETSCFLAYEHGATYPESFIHFTYDNPNLMISATKGNYFHNMPCSDKNPHETVWFEFGAIDGTKEELLKHYRAFVLDLMSECEESRKPYIFYNTWNYQERSRNFDHRGFIEELHFERVMRELEVAYQMGIEVFVVDTGWFSKTGDWLVNENKFPDKLLLIKEKLDSYHMKLGLWFNPTVAAKSSQIVTSHPEYRMSLGGKMDAFPVWETEESYGMCLCSNYWEFFAEKCISLYRELGVRYFKWDGIGQYGCDSPLHDHGNEKNSPTERSECYSYMMGLRMIKVVERLLEECPDAIVDFDVTEEGRFVGLGFLSVGKYFLCNNGPYAKDFDQPKDFKYLQKEPVVMDPYVNVFFYPGAARPRFCRQGSRYDKLIPSILFLTHFLPDPPVTAQMNTIASLMLGGNGIWGDLSILKEEDIELFARQFHHYKQVRDSVTKSYPIVTGEIGTSPEIYEKINPITGTGMVCFFTHKASEFKYVTQQLMNQPQNIVGAKQYEYLGNGHLLLTVEVEEDSAVVVYLY